MSLKILVTGATGTIGSFVCEQLKKVNADFIALVRSEEKAKDLNEKGVKTVIGDFSEISSLENALKGIDKVFLLSVTSPESPKLQGNLVKVAKEKGVKRIVKLSVRGAASDSEIGILRYHAITEKDIQDSGIAYTFLQPHSFMQNLVFDAESIKSQNAIFGPMGDGKIGMVDAHDIAAVAVKALTEDGHERKTYVLTGAKALSFYDISNAFTFFLERDIKYIPISAEDAHQGMLDAGMPEWLANDLTAINKIYASGQGSEISNDIEKVTGKRPRLLKEYLNDYIDLYK